MEGQESIILVEIEPKKGPSADETGAAEHPFDRAHLNVLGALHDQHSHLLVHDALIGLGGLQLPRKIFLGLLRLDFHFVRGIFHLGHTRHTHVGDALCVKRHVAVDSHCTLYFSAQSDTHMMYVSLA